MEELKNERRTLTDERAAVYTDAFPGSAKWQVMNRAEKAVDAFDAEHPEVIAQIKKEKEESRKEELKDNLVIKGLD